jgi:hypothetical protein
MNKNKQTNSLKRLLTMAGLVIITAASSQVYAQNGVGINPTGAAAHPSAALDVSATTQGFLPPRMTATQRDAILFPATGLVVFCTNCGINGGELEVFAAGIWRNMAGGTAAIPVPSIGQPFLGGILAYILQPNDPGYEENLPHGLIAAPYDFVAEWGCYGTTIAGADGLSIGAGNLCTIDIMDGCEETDVFDSNPIAARICGDLDLNDYSDWFLPSKDELHKLYLNIGQGAPAPNTNIGGFTDASYWSSSEYDANYAWTFLFPYGDVYFTFKYNEFLVRAVRAF